MNCAQKNNDIILKEVLSFDSISAAEDIIGQRHDDNPDVVMLGMALQMKHSEKKKRMLTALDDTGFSNKLIDYQRIIKAEGFELALEVPFEYTEKTWEKKDDGGNPIYFDVKKVDSLFVYYHPVDGILLSFDSYWDRKSVNGGRFMYNWLPTSPDWRSARCTSSGGSLFHGSGHWDFYYNQDLTPHHIPLELLSREPVFSSEHYEAYSNAQGKWKEELELYVQAANLTVIYSGYHDCREALRFNIRQLRENGRFLKEWRTVPFMWLIHYRDTKDEGYDYKAINRERFAMLPAEVRANIPYLGD